MSKDLVEVCTLSCRVSPPFSGPILLITSRLSLFPLSSTRCPFRSPYGFPASFQAEAFPKAGHRAYHVPLDPLNRLDPLCSPAVSASYPLAHDKEDSSPCSHCVAFWLKPLALHLQLVSPHGVYQAFAFAGHTVNPCPIPSMHFGERFYLTVSASGFLSVLCPQCFTTESCLSVMTV